MLANSSSVPGPRPSEGILDCLCRICRTESPGATVTQFCTSPMRVYRADGTIYSLCRICLSTIAAGREPDAVARAERHHQCDPTALACCGFSPPDPCCVLSRRKR